MESDFRPYRPGDEERIVELLNLIFNGWPPFDLNCSPLDYWKWKYPDNQEGMLITVAEADGRIIGCAHGTNRKAKIGREIVLCGFGADVGLHPDFRGRGVFAEMDKEQLRARLTRPAYMTYTITTVPTVIKKGGPAFPQPVLHMIRVRDIDKHLAMTPLQHPRILKTGFLALSLLRKGTRSSAASDKQVHIRRVDAFDERMDDFWDNVKNAYSFILQRTTNYLNWRYCDRRAGDFTVKIAEKDGKIAGFSVLRINRRNRDYPEGYLVDLLALPGEREVENALMADAVEFFEQESVNIVHACAVKGHRLSQLLNRYGFLNTRQNYGIFCRFYRDLDYYSDFMKLPPEKIHFQFGDTDYI